MAIEIEAKMMVGAFDGIRSRLRECGAKEAGTKLETNRILDSPGRDLLENGKGLRVRRARSLADHSELQTVTFKGPRRSGPLKTREEIELTVADGDADALLAALGYITTLSFEKRRETWELDGCKIELDELPFLGRFVEIEGPGEEPVLRLRERLALGDHPMIKSGYVELMMTYLDEHNIHEREIRLATPPVAGR